MEGDDCIESFLNLQKNLLRLSPRTLLFQLFSCAANCHHIFALYKAGKGSFTKAKMQMMCCKMKMDPDYAFKRGCMSLHMLACNERKCQ